MSNTYTWSIVDMERTIADGGVKVAHYNVSGTDGTYTANAYGSVNFSPDADADDFIAYDDLTEAVVIGWVKDSLGADIVTATEGYVGDKIAIQQTPVSANGKPW